MEKKEYCRMEDKKCFSVPENAVEVRPAVDIVEEDCGVKIMFEVPGANADTIDVSVAEGILTMRACSTLKRNGFPVCYQRSFQLSDMVDVKGISGKIIILIVIVEALTDRALIFLDSHGISRAYYT